MSSRGLNQRINQTVTASSVRNPLNRTLDQGYKSTNTRTRPDPNNKTTDMSITQKLNQTYQADDNRNNRSNQNLNKTTVSVSKSKQRVNFADKQSTSLNKSRVQSRSQLGRYGNSRTRSTRQQSSKPKEETAEQIYERMWKETGLGAKVGSKKAVETILDFLNLGEVLKIRLLQKNAKTFGKLYLEKRLLRINKVLEPIHVSRIDMIQELRRTLKQTTMKMIHQNKEDLSQIVKFRYPPSIIIKVFQIFYFLKSKTFPTDVSWDQMLDKLMDNSRNSQILADYLNTGLDWDLDDIQGEKMSQLEQQLCDKRLAPNNVQIVSQIFGCTFRKIRTILEIKDQIYHLGIDVQPYLKEKDILELILQSKFPEMNQTMNTTSILKNNNVNTSVLKTNNVNNTILGNSVLYSPNVSHIKY